MASGSLKALLAVLAVAGFQNRDKIGEMLKNATARPGETPQFGGEPMGTAHPQETASAQPSGGLDDILGSLGGPGGLGGLLGAGGLGSVVTSGLNDLLDQFRQAGQENKADSWVKTGANEPINDSELQQALGSDVLRDIAAKTGLSEEEVLKRLAQNLPDAVDGLTPDGTIPPLQGTA
jgi:uncharacterized protein YidB (DUF937 family)